MVELDGRLRLSARFRSEVVHIGEERTAVLVIDDFLSEPGLLVDYAAAHGRFVAEPGGYYPGERAPAAPIYTFALRAFLGQAIAAAFGLEAFAPAREKCDFSLVTTPPESLRVLQRMPHIDNTDPRHFAVLHYLCGPDQGGTSFYRHRETGFETVGQSRFAAYRNAVERRLASRGPPPERYIDGDNDMFERIATFDAAFNRVLVYRGLSLHSADIGPGCTFARDPRAGRLTANGFFWLA